MAYLDYESLINISQVKKCITEYNLHWLKYIYIINDILYVYVHNNIHGHLYIGDDFGEIIFYLTLGYSRYMSKLVVGDST